MLIEKKPSALLISLPWASLKEPSLELGLLCATLKEACIPCCVKHLNLFFPESLQNIGYDSLGKIFALNDFLFSGVLNPEISIKQKQWLKLKTCELLNLDCQNGGIDKMVEKLMQLRMITIPSWLDSWADQILASDPTLIVMTCMSDQTIASLSLAHLIKQKSISPLVVLTGNAVQDATGKAILNSFPFIDVVCNGEPESSILGLANASVGAIKLSDVSNILYRDSDKKMVAGKRAPQVDLNSLPIPDYDDFFADVKILSKNHQRPFKVARLPLDITRGCWWGQTKHCECCEMMEEELNYRFLSAEKVISTMNILHQRYNTKKFHFESSIFPYNYFNTLLPSLIGLGSPYSISSRIKTNISRDKFKLLAQAGFNKVHIGTDNSPYDFKKKETINYANLLLLGKRFGVTIQYHLQFGLPNENPDELKKIVHLIPLLSHLDAPTSKQSLKITRFSPIHLYPEKFGVPPSQHDPSYSLIFSSEFLQKTNFDLDDFCRFFYRPFDHTPRIDMIYTQMDKMIEEWMTDQTKQQCRLWYRIKGDKLEILDTRKAEMPTIHILKPLESRIYQNAIDPISLESLQQRCNEFAKSKDCTKAIKHFKKLGIILQENDHILALAIEKSA